MATVSKNAGCPVHKIGGVEDHIHIACSLARTIPIAELVQHLKQDSSKWIKTKGDRYKAFAWQNGYGAFSVGQSQLEDLRRYIANQREHHECESFQDEFRRMLTRYQTPFEEQYVWD